MVDTILYLWQLLILKKLGSEENEKCEKIGNVELGRCFCFVLCLLNLKMGETLACSNNNRKEPMERESLKDRRERGNVVDRLSLLKRCDWMEFREHVRRRKTRFSYVIDK